MENTEQAKRGKELDFCNFIYQKLLVSFHTGEKLNKRTVESIASRYGILDKNVVKELCELAIVYHAKELAQTDQSVQKRFENIVRLYRLQINLSHRTSQSVMLQQYSTPAPIAFLAGYFIFQQGDSLYFEPSAGNGLLTIALKNSQVWVNEIDEYRSMNLSVQRYANQMHQDATEPFGMDKKFDGVITNPPFGTLDKTLTVDDFPIKTLDHAMAIRALDCMKDKGRAAIIIGGHSEYDSEGRIKAGKNRTFFSYLYKHYNVSDVINIDGDLYSRQGTSFNVRLILIDGRKGKPEGFPPLSEGEATIKDFDSLFDRVQHSINGTYSYQRIRLIKAKALSKLKILELLCL